MRKRQIVRQEGKDRQSDRKAKTDSQIGRKIQTVRSGGKVRQSDRERKLARKNKTFRLNEKSNWKERSESQTGRKNSDNRQGKVRLR